MRGVRGHSFVISLFPSLPITRCCFKFTIELRVIELLRLTTMKILSNVVPPFRNSQSRQIGKIVELRVSISFCYGKTLLKISQPCK